MAAIKSTIKVLLLILFAVIINSNVLFCVRLKLDANVAVSEDQFVRETPDSDTPRGFTCISAHAHVTNQCDLEDDLDDIIAFPVFSKRSSRRLRRTSIEIYRKSLHDAESVASEEECDTVAVYVDSDTAAVDIAIPSITDDAFANEPVLVVSESDESQTSSINSSSVVLPKTGIIFYVMYSVL